MDIEERLIRIGQRHGELLGQIAPVEEERAAAIREAAAAGLSRRRIASLLGISFQRVDQIVRSAEAA